MFKYSSLKVHFLALSSTCCPVYVVMNGLPVSFSPYVPHLKCLVFRITFRKLIKIRAANGKAIC